MKFLIDKSMQDVADKIRAYPDIVAGQLLTPLTNYADAGQLFAIDNGAFSGFRHRAFKNLLERMAGHEQRCLFVAVPDVVGSARRTLEIFEHRYTWVPYKWPVALVAQDGLENLDVPWGQLDALFIGGCDPWKDSKSCLDLVRAAKILGKHVHVGRVNTRRRYEIFTNAGADTCDGTGVARYDNMLIEIAKSPPQNMSLLSGGFVEGQPC